MATQSLTSCNDVVALVVAENDEAASAVTLCAEPADTSRWQDRDFDWDGHSNNWNLYS